jgi:hypothetical protein
MAAAPAHAPVQSDGVEQRGEHDSDRRERRIELPAAQEDVHG